MSKGKTSTQGLAEQTLLGTGSIITSDLLAIDRSVQITLKMFCSGQIDRHTHTHTHFIQLLLKPHSHWLANPNGFLPH